MKAKKIIRLANKNYQITMRCGINRELGGWIFQWINNVKIIQPPKLIELYQNIVNTISSNNQKNSKLESVNFFNKD